MGGSCRTHGTGENLYTMFVGKPEGKGLLSRTRCGCKDNIRIDRRETGWLRCGLDSSGSGQEPVEGFCEHGNAP